MTDRTRWLDAQEQQAWRSVIEGFNRFEDRLDRQLKDEFGITLDDYEILVYLSEAEGRRVRMSDLADRLLASRSRMTYRVDRLEKAALVVRRPCAEDGRSLWAELTKSGLALLVKAAPGHVSLVRELLVDQFSRDEWLDLGRRFDAVAAETDRPHPGP